MVLVHGYVDGHVFQRLDFRVDQDLAVDDVFNLLKFLVGYLRKVRKVEAQAPWLNRGAGLLDVGAEDGAQRGVQQVGAGVVALDGVAAFTVNNCADVIADGERLL